MNVLRSTFFIAVLSLTACGGETKPPASGPASDPDAPTQPSDHGARTDLGTIGLAGNKFKVVRLGNLVPGKEGAFEVHPESASPTELAQWNLYLWVEDKAGTQLSASSKGLLEGAGLHFHVTPRDTGSAPYRVVLRLRTGDTDVRAGLPLDGHGHEHPEGPHSGVPAEFDGDSLSGHVELKLHDDKGDLELWLYEDAAYSKPFDLPLTASVEVEFVDVGGRKVSLRPRNTDKNEDEEGKPNVRDGRTNYFIYPTSAEDDASWLKGKEFQSIVIVRFDHNGQEATSDELVLRPHAH